MKGSKEPLRSPEMADEEKQKNEEGSKKLLGEGSFEDRVLTGSVGGSRGRAPRETPYTSLSSSSSFSSSHRWKPTPFDCPQVPCTREFTNKRRDAQRLIQLDDRKKMALIFHQ